MVHEPDIALLVSTFQRPGHLRRALASIAAQRDVDGRMELVVTDDGSTDETPQIVADFAASVRFPVHFTTHPHTTFRLSRCRNEGAAATTAPYLLFLDGDCVLPSDHVRVHLERRRPGVVMAGDSVRLDQTTSARITADVISAGGFEQWGPPEEWRRLGRLDRRSRLYRWLRHPTKPKLIGNNVGIWRADFARVNGYDENFQGWGCEDDDLRLRLRKSGVVIESILRWTQGLHLWHPTDPTAGGAWKEGPNVSYLLRPGRLTRCRYGLTKRSFGELSVRVVGAEPPAALAQVLGPAGQRAGVRGSEPVEVEILVLPPRPERGGRQRFSGRAELNVLVALASSAEADHAARSAHLFIGNRRYDHLAHNRQFSLDRLGDALAAVA